MFYTLAVVSTSSSSYASHVYCRVMFSVDFVYLHTHDILDPCLPMQRLGFLLTPLPMAMTVIGRRPVAN